MEDTPPDYGRKLNAQQHRTNDFRANLAATARDWEHRFPQHGGSNRVSREAGQETLHLVENMASFSLRFGCGSGTGCGELGGYSSAISSLACSHRSESRNPKLLSMTRASVFAAWRLVK
jgi:hypothetical protein